MPEIEGNYPCSGRIEEKPIITDKDKRLVAYHEAGHAVIARMLPNADPVHQVSIVPRGQAGGYTLTLPKEDKNYVSRGQLEDEITVLLGGRVAEHLVLQDINTGTSMIFKGKSDCPQNGY